MKELAREYTDRMKTLLGNDFDNYMKALQKLLISPFDINLGYSV